MTKTYSRGELLDWINSTLSLHYESVEQVSNGAAFCQILDILFPGDVKLRNVNYNADTEPESLANYKIIQSIFEKHGIDRNLNVTDLLKGKPMAAMEGIQTMRQIYEKYYEGGEYDGEQRRTETGCKGPGEQKQNRRRGASRAKRTTMDAKTPAQGFKGTNAQRTTTQRRNVTQTMAINRYGMRPATNQQIQQLKEKNDELKKDNQILLEERNFYYQKLQKVEDICQAKEGDEFAKQILEILYQTDEEHGFVSPDELDI